MRTVYYPIYTLRPYERGIHETLGKYNGIVMPSPGFQFACVHNIRIRYLLEHTLNVHRQPVLTHDKREIRLSPSSWQARTAN